jgi:hypothetical protein
MTPTAIQVGGAALIVGLLAFARNLGGWENKPLARGLGITAAILFVWWCFLLFPARPPAIPPAIIPQPSPSPIALPLDILPPPSFETRMKLPDGRTIITTSPEDLQSAFRSNTRDQFNRLLGGKWVKLSGKHG